MKKQLPQVVVTPIKDGVALNFAGHDEIRMPGQDARRLAVAIMKAYCDNDQE